MRGLSRLLAGGLILCVVAVMVGACAEGPPAASLESMCNGIDAAVGGCDAVLPSYDALTCEGVGTEAGVQLDERLRAVYNGPADTDGESKAVRAAQATSLVVGLANQHLRATGTLKDCTTELFVAAMEAQFSDEVRLKAGDYLYDGKPVSYEEFLADLAQVAGIIDMER